MTVQYPVVRGGKHLPHSIWREVAVLHKTPARSLHQSESGYRAGRLGALRPNNYPPLPQLEQDDMSNPHVEAVEEFPENPNVQAVETVTPPNTSKRVERYNKLTPAQAITAAGGIVMLVLGLIAVARTGVSDGMKLPTTSVALTWKLWLPSARPL